MNQTDHNRQNKIAVINDFSGFGRCSIAVSLPIISQLRIQCCAVPTSVFSNHTGFKEYFFDDYTHNMEEYISNWKKLDLRFKGILSGFLGSKKQIEIVQDFIRDFRTDDTKVIIDPVMPSQISSGRWGPSRKPTRNASCGCCTPWKCRKYLKRPMKSCGSAGTAVTSSSERKHRITAPSAAIRNHTSSRSPRTTDGKTPVRNAPELELVEKVSFAREAGI